MMEKLLGELAEAMESLTSIARPRARPLAVLLSSILSASLVAFSSSPYTLVIGLALLPFYTATVGSVPGRVLRAMLPVLLFSGAMVLPMALLGGPRMAAALAVARAGLAAAYVAAGFAGLGVNGLAAALSEIRAPRGLVDTLTLFMRFAPTYARELSKMLLARASRIYSYSGFRDRLEMLGDAAGDLIVRGYSHAWRLSLALSARWVNQQPRTPGAVYMAGRGRILYLVPLTLLLVEVCLRVWQ